MSVNLIQATSGDPLRAYSLGVTCGNPDGVRSQPAPLAQVSFYFAELPYLPNELYSLDATDSSVDPLRKALPLVCHLC